MTNQTILEHYDARECALAGRDPSDPSACKACVAQMATEPEATLTLADGGSFNDYVVEILDPRDDDGHLLAEPRWAQIGTRVAPSVCQTTAERWAREWHELGWTVRTRIVSAAEQRAAALLAARGAVVSFPKTMLTARKRGQGGSIVTVRAGSWSARYGVGPFVVKDLMDRKNFNQPDEVGVGPLDRGLAHGILLVDIVNVRVDQA